MSVMIRFFKWSIRAKMLASLLVVLPCVLMMMALVEYYQIQNQQRWRSVQQTIGVIGKSDDLMLQLSTMQTSMRDFGLNGEATHLDAYSIASQRYHQLFGDIATQVANDVAQTTRLANLELAVADWRTSILTPTMELRRTKDAQAFPQKWTGSVDMRADPSAGRQFTAIRRHMAGIRAAETVTLNQHVAQAEASSALVRRLLIIGPLLAVFSGVLVLVVVANRLGRRISLIAQAAQGISEGRLDDPYQLPSGEDEVGTLSAAFGRMKATIKEQLAQQQRSEEVVRENEKMYRLMAENATDMIARLSVDGVYLYVSPACRKLMGFEPEELVGQSAYAFFHPADLAQLHAQGALVLDGLDSTPNEYRVRHKNGSYVWVESISRAVYDLPTGMLLEIHLTTRDITERKQAAAALRARDEMVRSAFRDATVGMALVTLEGKWLQVNAALCALLGYSEAEMQRIDFQTITHPDDLGQQLPLLDQLLRGEIPSYQMEKRYFHKDGHIVWAFLSVSLVRDDAGRPMHCVSQIQDISARKQSENEIKNLNARLNLNVQQLEQSTREMQQLSDLVELLQSCESEQEAYAVIERTIVPLFPHDAGALSAINNSKNLVHTVARWGGFDGLETFTPGDCWTLRRSREYVVDDNHPSVLCTHFDHAGPPATMCVPMMARGDIVGVLHLTQTDGVISESKQRLVKRVAEDIGLLLSNLRLRETLRLQSIRDPLTGLFNRRYMEESFWRELSRAERRDLPVGVIMFDIDHFKQFNDRFGHPAGDLLLREVAACVQRLVRDEDIPCRFGGEEFAIIMGGSTLETTVERAETLRVAIKSLQVQYLNQPLGQITSSFGVAMFREHGSDVATLLAAADTALYRAKREGRDRVVCAPQIVEILDVAAS
jgi:diguanylate cyclase (GGDEF)-like protein/PAS domain S-box-containing protein